MRNEKFKASYVFRLNTARNIQGNSNRNLFLIFPTVDERKSQQYLRFSFARHVYAENLLAARIRTILFCLLLWSGYNYCNAQDIHRVSRLTTRICFTILKNEILVLSGTGLPTRRNFLNIIFSNIVTSFLKVPSRKFLFCSVRQWD